MTGLTFLIPFLALLTVAGILAWSFVQSEHEREDHLDDWIDRLDRLAREQEDRLIELTRPPEPRKPYDWSTEDDDA